MAASPNHPVESYARRVLSGDILAGRLVRLACARHLRDLEEGPTRGLSFDYEAARYAFDLFGFLCLPEGEGKRFVLQPFQQFIVGSLFGWKSEDETRRFRTAYCEMGKGSGKTPIAAGIGILGMMADNEAAAEIYSAATTQDQASLSFRDAKRMAAASPWLAKRLDIGINNIAHAKSGSFFRPVSSEHRGLDGKRVHMALIDEIHEHPTSLVVDKMRAGTKGRRQALIFEITNSGYDRTTVCWQHHEYSEKVLAGVLEDDSWFAYVCTLDPCAACADKGSTQPVENCPDCDDWRDEKTWLKANPNLGVSIQPKYLREQVREAVGMLPKANIVKRLNFCIWTEGSERVVPMEKWDLCKRPIRRADLTDRPCYGALDIGATSDFTAFVLLFPDDDVETVEVDIDPEHPEAGKQTLTRRSYTMLPFFWLPERPIKRDPRMEAQIDVWTRQGFIKRTGDEVVDYDAVFADIVKLAGEFSMSKVVLDYGFQAAAIANDLMSHFGKDTVEIFRQGIISMAGPFRELLELTVQGRLHHDGNPVLRWMASNVAAERKGGLVKPSKDKSTEKIDGITAATMALGVALANPTGANWWTPSAMRN